MLKFLYTIIILESKSFVLKEPELRKGPTWKSFVVFLDVIHQAPSPSVEQSNPSFTYFSFHNTRVYLHQFKILKIFVSIVFITRNLSSGPWENLLNDLRLSLLVIVIQFRSLHHSDILLTSLTFCFAAWPPITISGEISIFTFVLSLIK